MKKNFHNVQVQGDFMFDINGVSFYDTHDERGIGSFAVNRTDIDQYIYIDKDEHDLVVTSQPDDEMYLIGPGEARFYHAGQDLDSTVREYATAAIENEQTQDYMRDDRFDNILLSEHDM